MAATTARIKSASPLDATSVCIVLAGFAATDLATAGTVIFNNVGLFDLDDSNVDLAFAAIGEKDELWFW